MGLRSGTRVWRSRSAADPDEGRLVPNLVYATKTLVAERPTLAIASARVRRRPQSLRRDTDLVIEGYPRSANSFVVRAFSMSQAPLRIAHHTHAPGQVIVACRRRIPTLVLVRRPADAVARLAFLRPRVSLASLLRGWCRFYGPLAPWLDRFVVGRFEDVTTDLGAVMKEMNDRFGTRYEPFEHTPESIGSAFRAMESEWSTRIDRSDPAFEHHVTRPSSQRSTRVAEIEAKLGSARYERLMDTALALYGELTEPRNSGGAGSPGSR